MCRRFIDETGAALLLSHHDTKPPVGQSDNRSRPHRASGGALFSIADHPVHLERIGDEEAVLAVPDSWMFAECPAPLRLDLQVTATGARLTGSPTSGGDAAALALHTRILDYLGAHPGTSGSHLVTALRTNRQGVYAALDSLEQAGQVIATKKGNARLWTVKSVPEQFRNSSGTP